MAVHRVIKPSRLIESAYTAIQRGAGAASKGAKTPTLTERVGSAGQLKGPSSC